MHERYEVGASEITELVRDLALKANMLLPDGLKRMIGDAYNKEKMSIAKEAFSDILKNAELAAEKNMPICQDCGLAVVFIEIGQRISVCDGSIEDAVNEGIRRAYTEGYLRKSVVKDPLFRRENSGDNNPEVIHWIITTGKDIKITVSPKGMGSENMSRIYMLKPADGAERSHKVSGRGCKNRWSQPVSPDSPWDRHRRQFRNCCPRIEARTAQTRKVSGTNLSTLRWKKRC